MASSRQNSTYLSAQQEHQITTRNWVANRYDILLTFNNYQQHEASQVGWICRSCLTELGVHPCRDYYNRDYLGAKYITVKPKVNVTNSYEFGHRQAFVKFSMGGCNAGQSFVDLEEYGERSLPSALPWDQIRSTYYNRSNYISQEIIDNLKILFKDRVCRKH